jgi:hypothetical protein
VVHDVPWSRSRSREHATTDRVSSKSGRRPFTTDNVASVDGKHLSKLHASWCMRLPRTCLLSGIWTIRQSLLFRNPACNNMHLPVPFYYVPCHAASWTLECYASSAWRPRRGHRNHLGEVPVPAPLFREIPPSQVTEVFER